MDRFATALCTLLLSLSFPAWAQQNLDEVEIEVVPVAEGVYMLVGAGGNIGLSVGEDGAFLIDDQFAPLTDKIRAAVATVTDEPVRFVLNTHWHGDHTGGNESLGEAGALIVAHDNVRVRMSTEQVNTLFDRTTPPSPEAALPAVTFTDAVTFHVNGDTLHAFHVAPAHTDGDAVVHFRGTNVIHMGDLYFASGFPFIDLDSGGSVDGVLAAVDGVLTLIGDDTRIIPGHGPLSDKAALAAYRDVIATVRDRVQVLVAEGKSVDEVLEAGVAADYADTWGQGFMDTDTFVRIVYTSLAAR